MSNEAADKPRVLVVLDPDFGDRLRSAWPGKPVWITMSPANAPVVRALWVDAPDRNHLTGITGFRHDPRLTPEEHLLGELDVIELHHGSCSAEHPWATLEVIGAQPTLPIREALLTLGFSTVEQTSSGFVASRTFTGFPFWVTTVVASTVAGSIA